MEDEVEDNWTESRWQMEKERKLGSLKIWWEQNEWTGKRVKAPGREARERDDSKVSTGYIFIYFLTTTLEASFPCWSSGLLWWVCWGDWLGWCYRGVNERQWKAQRSTDANCFYSHSSSLPVSDFSTSDDLPLLLSLHPLLSLRHIHFLFSSLSSYFFPISSPIYPHSFTQISFHRLLPIASPLSYILTPSLHFNLGGVPVASICIAATHWRWVWTA